MNSLGRTNRVRVSPILRLQNPLRSARPAGIEPTTYGLEVRCSIQLSYRRKVLAKKSVVSKGIAARWVGSARSARFDGFFGR